MIKKVSYDSKTIQSKLAFKIAKLEIQLANEQAAKKAIIKYAEELEQELEGNKECDSISEASTQDTEADK